MTSLWFGPDETTASECRALIARLAARYAAPVFPPHVTLLGDLPGDEAAVVARARTLATGLRRLVVTFPRIGWRDEYFRCFYLEVESDEVVAARGDAEALFGREPSPYLPHLSLIYGELPADEKARLRAELNRRLPMAGELQTLEVWRTRGEVRSWAQIAALTLQPRARP